MATRSDKVMAMVEEELSKNPGVSNEELFEKAKKIDKKVGDLTSRQFNARFPLQVKRRLAAAKPRRGRARAGRRGAAARQADRGAVREVLLDFASDVAGTQQNPGELVKVLKGVDGYVERVIRAAGAK